MYLREGTCLRNLITVDHVTNLFARDFCFLCSRVGGGGKEVERSGGGGEGGGNRGRGREKRE